MSQGQGVIRASEVTVRMGEDFYCRLVLKLILKQKDVAKMNSNLMVPVQEIIYLG